MWVDQVFGRDGTLQVNLAELGGVELLYYGTLHHTIDTSYHILELIFMMPLFLWAIAQIFH